MEAAPLTLFEMRMQMAQPPAAPKDSPYKMPYDAAEFTKHLYGYAQAYAVAPEAFGELRAKFNRERLSEGDILVIEPKAFGGSTRVLRYRQGLRPDWYRGSTDQLSASLQCYSKHKPFDFGGALFVEGARQMLRTIELEVLRDSVHQEVDEKQRRMLAQMERERELSAGQATQIEELRAQLLSEYRRGAESMRQRVKDLEDQMDDMRAENAQLRANNDSMRRAFGEFQSMRDILGRVQRIERMPETCADVAAYFRQIFADRIDFTERGMRSAARCDINPAVLWACLYSAATILVDLHRSAVQNIEKRFKEATGWDLATSEGTQTRKNPEYMDLRRDTYDGREISVEPHIKFPKSLHRTGAQYQRLYYAYDPYTRRILVGYVGDHLENYLSLGFH